METLNKFQRGINIATGLATVNLLAFWLVFIDATYQTLTPTIRFDGTLIAPPEFYNVLDAVWHQWDSEWLIGLVFMRLLPMLLIACLSYYKGYGFKVVHRHA